MGLLAAGLALIAIGLGGLPSGDSSGEKVATSAGAGEELKAIPVVPAESGPVGSGIEEERPVPPVRAEAPAQTVKIPEGPTVEEKPVAAPGEQSTPGSQQPEKKLPGVDVLSFLLVQEAGTVRLIQRETALNRLRPGDRYDSVASIAFQVVTGPSRLRFGPHLLDLGKGAAGSLERVGSSGWQVHLKAGEIFCQIAPSNDLLVGFPGGSARSALGAFGIKLEGETVRVLSLESEVICTGSFGSLRLAAERVVRLSPDGPPRFAHVDPRPLLAWRGVLRPNPRVLAHRTGRGRAPSVSRSRRPLGNFHRQFLPIHRSGISQRKRGTSSENGQENGQENGRGGGRSGRGGGR